MPLLDQDLPARAQQGDENALAALIARMMPAIRKGAAECTAPGLDFDDAVQEGRRPRGSWDFPPKTWPMRWPVRAASCAVRPQPRIQAICLRHISTCPQ